MAKPAACTAQLDETDLTLWSFCPDGPRTPYRMYADDGISTNYDDPAHWREV